MRLNISLVLVLGLLLQPFSVAAECTPASIVELFTNSSISEVKSFRDLPRAVQDSMLEEARKRMPESPSFSDATRQTLKVQHSRIADIGQPWSGGCSIGESELPRTSLQMAGHVDDIWFSVAITGGIAAFYHFHFFCMEQEKIVQEFTYYRFPKELTNYGIPTEATWDWLKSALKEECLLPVSEPLLTDEIRNRCSSYIEEYEKSTASTPTPTPALQAEKAQPPVDRNSPFYRMLMDVKNKKHETKTEVEQIEDFNVLIEHLRQEGGKTNW